MHCPLATGWLAFTRLFLDDQTASCIPQTPPDPRLNWFSVETMDYLRFSCGFLKKELLPPLQEVIKGPELGVGWGSAYSSLRALERLTGV